LCIGLHTNPSSACRSHFLVSAGLRQVSPHQNISLPLSTPACPLWDRVCIDDVQCQWPTKLHSLNTQYSILLAYVRFKAKREQSFLALRPKIRCIPIGQHNTSLRNRVLLGEASHQLVLSPTRAPRSSTRQCISPDRARSHNGAIADRVERRARREKALHV
jgi:hypothetical protein